MENLTKKELKIFYKYACEEKTIFSIYKNLAKKTESVENKKILEKISIIEKKHKNILKDTFQFKKPLLDKKVNIFVYTFFYKILGLKFTIELLEKKELKNISFYKKYKEKFPELKKIIKDEDFEEQKIIKGLKDEKLTYASSIVLGLSDAIVELSGTLAGLSFAFSHSKTVGIAGAIIGLSASLSMGASEYLSTKEEIENKKSPIRGAFYTFISYLTAVFFLVSPYFIFKNIFIALLISISIAILLIIFYTFYISVSKKQKFSKRFLEMFFIMFSVMLISFAFGFFLKKITGIDI